MATSRRKRKQKSSARKSRKRRASPPVTRTSATEITAGHDPIDFRNDVVESSLLSGEHSGPLEDFFGAAQYAELRQLAQEAAVSVRRGDRVIILPGIMGSKLGYHGRFILDDTLWINPLNIALGRLSEMRLPDKPPRLSALGVVLFAYLKLKLKLRIAGHDAEFFPYDWRLDLVRLGKGLAAEVKSGGRTTHLVAHSMGGLVARAALLEKPNKLGRIVMLGTPNFGSFSPIQAFRGAHSIVQKVDFIDRFHTAADLAGIFGTFPGLCQMIPSPQKYPADFFKQRAKDLLAERGAATECRDPQASARRAEQAARPVR